MIVERLDRTWMDHAACRNRTMVSRSFRRRPRGGVDLRRELRRGGWSAIPAVANGELHEIKAPLILQPGPAALTDGLDAIRGIIGRWAA